MTGRGPAAGRSRLAYVNCQAGVAGDMLLGALVDAGADPAAIAADLAGLGLDGCAVTFERVQRGGIAATWANVAVADPLARDATIAPPHPHRPVREVHRILAGADLPEAVRDAARRVFAVLAAAEGAVHGIEPGDVELHEVGSLDAIIDVVGVCSALHHLSICALHASPVAVGHGTVRAAHGDLPNPPPAVVGMLATRGVPVVGVDTTMELATPTGTAILVALADSFGPLPTMTVETVGYGAGTADPPARPNVVQAVVGTASEPATAPPPGRRAVELAVNVDDVSGEVVAHTVGALLASGAHDAWVVPVVMKKGRPAHTITALVDPADADRIAAVLLAETGSLGLRATAVERWPQRRDERTVRIGGHVVRVKVAAGRVKVEHDDAAAAAAALGRPLRDVLRDAETLAIRSTPGQ